MNDFTELPAARPSLDQSQNIYNNHRRQQEILQNSGGTVIGYHGTSIQNAETILEVGFNGTNLFPGGNEDMLYKPKNAVWFQEETELPDVLSTAKTRYPNGFAIIKAELNKPSIDPLWRPFWVVNDYRPNDQTIKLIECNFFSADGSLREKVEVPYFYVQRSALSSLNLTKVDLPKNLTSLLTPDQFLFLTNTPINFEAPGVNYSLSPLQISQLARQYPNLPLHSYRVTLGIPQAQLDEILLVPANKLHERIQMKKAKPDEYNGIFFPAELLPRLSPYLSVSKAMIVDNQLGIYQSIYVGEYMSKYGTEIAI